MPNEMGIRYTKYKICKHEEYTGSVTYTHCNFIIFIVTPMTTCKAAVAYMYICNNLSQGSNNQQEANSYCMFKSLFLENLFILHYKLPVILSKKIISYLGESREMTLT